MYCKHIPQSLGLPRCLQLHYGKTFTVLLVAALSFQTQFSKEIFLSYRRSINEYFVGAWHLQSATLFLSSNHHHSTWYGFVKLFSKFGTNYRELKISLLNCASLYTHESILGNTLFFF